MNQEQKVKKHLESGRHITGVIAQDMYRIRDLPKRISTLRKEGMNILGVMKRDLQGQRYHEYSLA